MTFKQAVEATPAPISSAYENGKEALQTAPHNHQNLVTCQSPWKFTGSIELDEALKDTSSHRGANRWDYGVGVRHGKTREIAIWIEVHGASDSEVEPVLRKLAWLKMWLSNEASQLKEMTRRHKGVKNYYWIATPTGIYMRRGSKKARELSEAGLDFPQLRLDI